MHTVPSIRTRRIAAIAAAPVAILIAAGMVWQSSNAAFTATTRNSGNAWSTGSVMLTDDDLGRAGFTEENLVPGQTGEKCIVVTSNSNVAGEVRAYVEHLSGSAVGLEDRITLRVERGTGGTFDNCTGFTPVPGALPAQTLRTLTEVNHDYATGGAIWPTTGTVGESQTYRGTWTFNTTGMTQQQIDALQGARVSIDLVWELQSDEPGTTP